MNSQIGKESEYYPITGKHSLHQESNGNGMKLIQFATAHEMVTDSTLFVHKVTWKSPDGEIYPD
jgi:hypothetical protein